MNKKVIIVTNNHGGIGANDDYKTYHTYFTSLEGGAWDDSEICEIKSPSKKNLLDYLDSPYIRNLDYLVLIFSGHGSLAANMQDTELCLRGNVRIDGYTVTDREIQHKAKRQLSIFDCCRYYEVNGKQLIVENVNASKQASDEYYTRAKVREVYERCIDVTPKSWLNLYACPKGGSTQGGDGEGGVFTNALTDIDQFHQTVEMCCAPVNAIKDAYDLACENPLTCIPRYDYVDERMFGLPWHINPEMFH